MSVYKFEVYLGHHHREVLKHFPKMACNYILQSNGDKIQGASTKKLLSQLADFGRYKGVGGLSESVKKGKFMTKIFLPDNVK